MTKAANPHCDHANWRNHRPEDDIEVSGASHKPDCSVHYNDPKRLNCNCGLWEAAKPVSDDESCSQAKHAAELVRKLRSNAQVCRDEQARVDEYYKPELANNACEWDETADTIEALQARIKDLDEAASELLTGWDSLVVANAELERRIYAALALCGEPREYYASVYDFAGDIYDILTGKEQER